MTISSVMDLTLVKLGHVQKLNTKISLFCLVLKQTIANQWLKYYFNFDTALLFRHAYDMIFTFSTALKNIF